MKPYHFIIILITAFSLNSNAQQKPVTEPTKVMLFGSTHFGQESFHKQGESMDLFSAARQKEVADINNQIAKYKPDLILIEREPSEQHTVDSLYQLYQDGKLQFNQLKYGRAEEYQFGYNLAKQLGLSHVYGVNFYQGLSTRLFKDGKNLEAFTNSLTNYSLRGRSLDEQLKERKLSLKGYLLQLNSPELYQLTYYNIYINPVRVTNGSFGKVDNTVDTTRIDKEHIGAEYVSIFYNRELKIFSNILSAQQTYQGKRILVIMGQRHAASLSKLFANDPAFTLVPLSYHLK